MELINKRYRLGWIVTLGVILLTILSVSSVWAVSSVTVMCYMNGDNDLSEEILHAVDMMETVGSSEAVNVLVLVDGHPDWLGPYDEQWAGARLLRISHDESIGQIRSPVIEEWGETNLGEAATLERFVRTCLRLYPAQRYIFHTFAHGQGVIDTGAFRLSGPGKALSISRDDTSGRKMSLDQFHQALKQGLDGNRFDLMVLFSCLSNMVEVGYALSDVTDYLVGSEDEIRLLNDPPGSFQVRGLKFEDFIANLRDNPAMPAPELGRWIVDDHIQGYNRDLPVAISGAAPQWVRLKAGMALINCGALPDLVRRLDTLAQVLMDAFGNAETTAAFTSVQTASQRFASFMNLEYYDLQDFISQLCAATSDPAVYSACERILEVLQPGVVLYERHTEDYRANGMSIYLSNPLVPENIFRAHQTLYRACRFSRDTRWDEMIDAYRFQVQQSKIAANTASQ